MDKEKIKLQALVTLDEVSESAINKMLQGKNSFIRSHEKKIVNQLDFIISKSRTEEPGKQDVLDELSGKLLDVVNEMNTAFFKLGMQTGAQVMLELLQIL